MVPMMANLSVHCLMFHLDKMMDVRWVHLMVLFMALLKVGLRYQHWGVPLGSSDLEVLGFCEGAVLGSAAVEVLGSTLGSADGNELGYFDGPFDGSNDGNLRVYCLMIHLDKTMDLR